MRVWYLLVVCYRTAVPTQFCITQETRACSAWSEKIKWTSELMIYSRLEFLYESTVNSQTESSHNSTQHFFYSKLLGFNVSSHPRRSVYNSLNFICFYNMAHIWFYGSNSLVHFWFRASPSLVHLWYKVNHSLNHSWLQADHTLGQTGVNLPVSGLVFSYPVFFVVME